MLFTCKINHTHLRYLLIVRYVRNMKAFNSSSSDLNCHLIVIKSIKGALDWSACINKSVKMRCFCTATQGHNIL